jgi:hypothetical protein
MSYFSHYTNLSEEKLNAKERNQLSDDVFGIPSLRKYPMPDKGHVLQAIRMFHHCPKGHEKELANNIKKKMQEYNIPKELVSPNNPLYKYL